jgi:hypothetical protein
MCFDCFFKILKVQSLFLIFVNQQQLTETCKSIKLFCNNFSNLFNFGNIVYLIPGANKGQRPG